MSAGTLPTGLVLDAATGRIHGTPTVAGTYPAQITATDSAGCAGILSYVFAVWPTPPPSTIAAQTTGLMITNGGPIVNVPVVDDRAESDSVAFMQSYTAATAIGMGLVAAIGSVRPDLVEARLSEMEELFSRFELHEPG